MIYLKKHPKPNPHKVRTVSNIDQKVFSICDLKTIKAQINATCWVRFKSDKPSTYFDIQSNL